MEQNAYLLRKGSGTSTIRGPTVTSNSCMDKDALNGTHYKCS